MRTLIILSLASLLATISNASTQQLDGKYRGTLNNGDRCTIEIISKWNRIFFSEGIQKFTLDVEAQELQDAIDEKQTRLSFKETDHSPITGSLKLFLDYSKKDILVKAKMKIHFAYLPRSYRTCKNLRKITEYNTSSHQ